ncbi:hypothetical protein Tco_1147159, partial [Tanacetum coccineum]
QVKVLKEGQNVDLKSKDNISDSCAQSVKIDHLKQTLVEHLKEKESLMQMVTSLKNDFKKEESRYIDREITLEKRIKQLDNISPHTPSNRPTKVEVPKELPKVSMVNTSLKKLKHHLAGFNVVIKERTTATTITEGSWGFEHTKACFRDEIIPFVKALKDNSVSNQSAPSFVQYFELNELKAQSQEKDMVIKKLKERIISLSENMNEDKIKKDIEEIETINIELDHRLSKMNLRKLKGHSSCENVVTKHTIDPEMLKIDVEPITPKLLNKRTTHSVYVKHIRKKLQFLKGSS